MLAPTPVFVPVLMPVSVKVANSSSFDERGCPRCHFGGRRNSNQQTGRKYRSFPRHFCRETAYTLLNQASTAYRGAVS
jgi:hypothetical protein